MIRQFPHCDARILHAPGECEFCDLHPEWQELCKAWMVAFTGHEPKTSLHAGTQVPCPADFNRPAGSRSDHRMWSGNVATADYETPAPTRPDPGLTEKDPGRRSFWARVFPWLW